MHRSPDQALALLAEQHHGIFATQHVKAVGMSKRDADWRVASGVWIVLHRGVYRHAGTPLSWRGKLLAACWAGGMRAAASHRSAAELWELPGRRIDMVEIMCPRWRRARHDGLIVHETKVLTALDITAVDGIPVTTVNRTLLDLGAVCAPATVERALENALRRDLTTLKSLKPMLARLGRQGRNGAGVLRALVDERDPDQSPTESDMETWLLQVLRANGLPPAVPQYVIRDAAGRFVARVDAAIMEWRIALEYESIQEHTGKSALLRDNPRRRKIGRAGWTPLGVTIEDLKCGGTELCSDIRAIARRAS
jgi:predicted transcriptional regulator of viral defense system